MVYVKSNYWRLYVVMFMLAQKCWSWMWAPYLCKDFWSLKKVDIHSRNLIIFVVSFWLSIISSFKYFSVLPWQKQLFERTCVQSFNKYFLSSTLYQALIPRAKGVEENRQKFLLCILGRAKLFQVITALHRLVFSSFTEWKSLQRG